MRNDLTTEQLQQPINVSLPLGALLGLTASPQPGAPVHTSASAHALPAIGSAYGTIGIFAGLTIDDCDPYELVLLPGEFNGNWKDAAAWAKEQGGVLPSRVDALILWQNLPNEFKKEAYWTDTQHAADSDYAWYQYFNYGYQNSINISHKLRARSVRRLAI